MMFIRQDLLLFGAAFLSTLELYIMYSPTGVTVLGRLNNLPVQEHLIHIGRLQHKQEEYLAVYPLGKIPCLKVSLTKWAKKIPSPSADLHRS